MTTDDELRRLAEAATPGPWVPLDMETRTGEVNPDGHGWWWVWRETDSPYYAGIVQQDADYTVTGKDDGRIYHVRGSVAEGMTTDGRSPQDEADVRFIAAANPQAVLALLDRVAAAEATVERLTRAVTALDQATDDLAASVVQVEAENAALRATVEAARAALPWLSAHHGHWVPGIWDDDNGDRAGKPCEACALVAAARAALDG